MPATQIRASRRDDVPALSALGRHAFTATYADSSNRDELLAHTEAHFSEDAISTAIARSSVRYFMAENGETCTGLLKVRTGPVRDPVPASGAIEVQQLYVSPDYQRQGIGGQLMNAAVDFARESAAPGIYLSVWSKADWAVSFYERYGFTRLGDEIFLLGKTEYLDWLMWYPFRPADEERPQFGRKSA